MTLASPVRDGETPSRKQASYELVPPGARRVLDVGCGAGSDVFSLAERLGPDCLIVGVDISLERVDEAQHALRSVALNVRFAVADARALPFPDDGFDVVRADGLFSEIDERVRVVRELGRVTAPGGCLLIHDREAIVLAPSEDGADDDLLGLLRRAGLAQVALSEPRLRHASEHGTRWLTLAGTKPTEPRDRR
jgi:ubiquinone/menaquinone biosynthesis C-methylase UbiE